MKQMAKEGNNALLTQTIDYLRFPLTVGVVFAHSYIGHMSIHGIDYSVNAHSCANYIMVFFSQVFGRITVPLFFFISGYMFFYKTDFNAKIYKKKLQRRYRSIIIPYIIWNFLGFLILLTEVHPTFAHLFPGFNDLHINITTFLSCFWNVHLTPTENIHCVPINFPLWYIRDLIVLFCIAPVIYWLLKHKGYIFLSVIGFVWFFNWGQFIGLPKASHDSMLFFPLGAYLSMNSIDFTDYKSKTKWSPYLFLLVAVADTFTYGRPDTVWIHKLAIIIGSIAIIHMVACLLRKNYIKTNKQLSESSFFLYLIHGLFILLYLKVLLLVIHPKSQLSFLFVYFFVVTTTVLVSLFMHYLLKKYLPSIAKALTGGR